MKIIIPYSQGRISPVFDVAEHFYLIEVRNGMEFLRQECVFTENDIFARIRMFADLKADVLICGAISQVQENALRDAGIKLLTFVCGELEEVIKAFIQGDLMTGAFQMPGCCGKRRRRRYRGGRGQIS